MSCIICYDNKNITITPCCKIEVCDSCWLQLQNDKTENCPNCREQIGDFIRDNVFDYNCKESFKLSDLRTLVNSKRNILIHGPGGCGKSHAIRNLTRSINNQHVHVTATTGIAALNISTRYMPAKTIHRFSGIKTGDADVKHLISYIERNDKAVKRWKDTKILIIDEVSMLGANFFKKLDTIAKYFRKNNKPMGGIQMIFSGDFLQLPPVKDDYVFTTNVWRDLNIAPIIAETPYRYKDKDFFNFLLRVRKGEVTEDDIRTISRRVRCNNSLNKELDKLKHENPGSVIKPTVFFSKKKDVYFLNKRELEKLDSKEYVFTCTDTTILKDKDKKIEPEYYTKVLDENFPRELRLKVGAQVMLTVNISVEDGFVNGSRGVINDITDSNEIVVMFLNGRKLSIPIHSREIEDEYAIVTRSQIPLVLSSAMTIHKSQGATLDYAVVDLGPSIFAEGQAYVALSRCRNMKGLFVSEFTPMSIKTNQTAVKYIRSIEK